MLKVCDIVQSYTHSSGGIRTYLLAKREYVRSRPDLSHVLITPGEQDACTTEGRLISYTLTGRPIPGCHPYRYAWGLGRMLAILRREAPDVIEVANPCFIPWMSFLHRHRNGGAVVGYYHADFPEAYCASFVRRKAGEPAAGAVGSLARSYARRLYSRCDATLTASTLFEDLLRDMGIPNVVRIPLGVDTRHFHPGKRDPSCWSSLGIAPGEPVLLYCGRLDLEKDVMLLVRAWDGLPGPGRPHLVLVGEGPLRGMLTDLARTKTGLHVLPYERDRGKLAVLLASADAYVTAGPHETFGLSVIEAQAAGLPVLGVEAGALRERVTPGTGCLVPPGDTGAMAEGMQLILAADRSAMGAAARRLVEDQFSWGATFGRLFDLYADVAWNGCRPASHRPGARTAASTRTVPAP